MFRIEVKVLNHVESLAVDLLTSLHTSAHMLNMHMLTVGAWLLVGSRGCNINC